MLSKRPALSVDLICQPPWNESQEDSVARAVAALLEQRAAALQESMEERLRIKVPPRSPPIAARPAGPHPPGAGARRWRRSTPR